MDKIKDEAFIKFLEKIQGQNKADLALQALQVKYEREMASEDNDKREEQLDELAKLLEKIEKSITGMSVNFDFKQMANALENQTQILNKSLEEQALLRKISEGSLEYDKESAQYRNTSGRELTSDVSGKTVKQGGYVDFETAANRLQGQGKRVRESEANQIKLKPIEMGVKTPITGRPGEVEPKDEDKEEKITGFGNLKDLGNAIGSRIKGIFDFMTKKDVEKKKDEVANAEVVKKEVEKKKDEVANAEVVKKEVEKKKDDKLKSTVDNNPEADNIQTSQEIIADSAKQDVLLTKENNELLEQQLKELKKIHAALSPSAAPSELTSGKPSTTKEKEKEKEEESGGGLGIGEAIAGIGGFAKKAGGALVKGAKAVGTGALAAGKGLARFAGSTGGKALGAAAAVGLGAYTAYKGYTGAEEEKQKELEAITAKEKTGELTSDQATEQKKEVAAKATENKGGAIGKGTGMAAGAIGGGIAGAKVGAAIGTFFGGPVGTAIGAGIGTIAGGAIGAISGSSVGQNIGGVIGKGVAGVKSFFGMEDVGEKTKEAVQGKTTSTEIQFSEMTFAKADPDNYKKFVEFRDKKTEEIANDQAKKFNRKEPSQTDMTVAQTLAKVEAVKKFQKEIEAAGAGKVTTKTENKNEKQQQSTGTPSGDKKPGVSTPQDTSKQRTQAIEQYQTSKQAETAASDKLKEFEKANPFDYREKPTPTQQFLEMPGTGKFSDPKKQAEYDALVNEKEKAYSSKEKAQEQYQKIEGTQREKQLPSGRIQQNIEAPFKKLEALTNRFGYKKEQFLSSDGKTYDMGSINKAYEKEMQKELNTPVDKTKVEAVPKTDKASLVKGQEEKGFLSKAADTAKSVGSSIAGFFGFGKKDEPAPKTGPVEYKDGTKGTLIADEPVVPGKPLSEKQMAVIEMSKSMGNKYSPEIESQFAKQRQASVTPASSPSTGPAVARTSTENADLTRAASKPAPAVQPIVSSNVSNVNTTSYVPVKPSPRSERSGSALDRYNDRVAAY